MIRTLLVDDEELARSRLRKLLSVFTDVEIIGEACDGEQAMEMIQKLKPDLVFLDIQMPGCSGTEVAQSLPSPAPRVIFCTAYDQYALEAFELSAVDYLLKPVTRPRLAHAIERVRKLAPQNIDSAIRRMSQGAAASQVRFLARRAGRYRVVLRREVLYFSSEEGLTRLHTLEQDYMMDPTLNDLEARLDPSIFCRISRAAIVNLDYVLEVLPMPGGYGMVTLRNKKQLDVSRRRLKDLITKLGGAKD